MPYKLVLKRGCSKKASRVRPFPACYRVYNPETKRHFSRHYMPLDKAERQIGYLRKNVK